MTKWVRCKRSPAAGPLLAGAAGVAACVLQAFIFGLPIPAIHDECSYLLAADTFLNGRCANPPHPFWQHFETIHVLQQPTYASKYPPGQGLFLAAGRLIGGHPVVGVWLGIGLACVAGTWMLQAFAPRRWATVGGLLMASWLGFSEWGWSYMGGGAAAAAGALFLGGWARVMRRPAPRPAAIMAIGLALLAITRPFEGLLLFLTVAAATGLQRFRRPSPTPVLSRPVLAPAALVLVPFAFCLAYYNHEVTGNALRLPYVEHAAQYDVAPVLLIQNPYPTPDYRHEPIRTFHLGHELPYYVEGRTAGGWLEHLRDKFLSLWNAYLGWTLSLTFLALPRVLVQSPRTRLAVIAVGVVFGVVLTVETWGAPHYVAPVAALVYLVVVQCFRRIYLSCRHRPALRKLVAGWLTVGMLLPAVPLASPLAAPLIRDASPGLPAWLEHELKSRWLHHVHWAWAEARAGFERELRGQGGRHLVFVHYFPGHSVHEEWVENEADIDKAPVVWARELTPTENIRLCDYFPDRTVWVADVHADGWGRRIVRPPIAPPRILRPARP
jgi:hypothetical protein